jgi:hypothetical protein
MGSPDLPAQAATWVGVAASAIATFGGVLYAAIAVVKVLVEKKYDARFREVEEKAAQLAAENAVLKASLTECKDHHAESEKDRRQIRAMLDSLTKAMVVHGVKIDLPADDGR